MVIHPEQNYQCAGAIRGYQKQLASNDPAVSGFQVVTLDECVEALRVIGDQDIAEQLHARYLDFGRIERAIFG